MEILIISGLSGAGKSRAAALFAEFLIFPEFLLTVIFGAASEAPLAVIEFPLSVSLTAVFTAENSMQPRTISRFRHHLRK